MANFQQQLEKSKRITPDIASREMFAFIESLSNLLSDLNKSQINKDSQDVFGKAIGFYSEATEYITTNNALLGKGGKIKKAGDPFTGFDTGDWLNSFFNKVQNNSIFFGATDSKTLEILTSKNWLSDQLFGLTEENLNMVIETKIKPFMINYYKKELGL